MKLTPPDSIKESEKEFIDTINAELDWEAIEHLIQERHNFILQDEVDYKHGDLTIYNNEIAYRFEFEVKVPIALICDRKGECLSISSSRQEQEDSDDMMENEEIKEPVHRNDQEKRAEQMASDIVQKINDINREEE